MTLGIQILKVFILLLHNYKTNQPKTNQPLKGLIIPRYNINYISATYITRCFHLSNLFKPALALRMPMNPCKDDLNSKGLALYSLMNTKN